MAKIRTVYVDHFTGKMLRLEREDDGLVSPPVIQLHDPLIGPIKYLYSYNEFDTFTSQVPNDVY